MTLFIIAAMFALVVAVGLRRLPRRRYLGPEAAQKGTSSYETCRLAVRASYSFVLLVPLGSVFASLSSQ